MYASKEIRWFTQTVNEQLLGAFEEKGLSFHESAARTDFYLPLPDRADMSIKLREGNIEIKQRMGTPKPGKLTPHTAGYFEDWVKWSFNLGKQDPLSAEIIDEKKYSWTAVYKERMGMKITNDHRGNILFRDITAPLPYGCQLEYTKIVIAGEEWFTFALEWFGDTHFELDTSIISGFLRDTAFQMEDSMGYGGFLKERA